MGKSRIILMADVVGSRNKDQRRLNHDFSQLAKYINQSSPENFLSPVTVTLGDEFQSIASGLRHALSVVLLLEEYKITKEKDFALRYVVFQGEIDTPINKEIAYGMLGEGLTNARMRLGELKKVKSRFHFELEKKDTEMALNDLFVVIQKIIDGWTIKKDYYIVAEFLKTEDYKVVAERLEKDRSLIWKRKKNLQIDEYNALKRVAYYITDQYE